ncbi:MAG: DUF3368 domain-containing protein [Fimbriimonadales bacterium]|nr:DUF3368 domain-containing protein [Fimbriimonadales bacterium]
MRDRVVVADSSVLIALASIGRFDLLEVLFKKLTVPVAVHDEVCGALGQGKPGDMELRDAMDKGWITLAQASSLIAPPYSGMRTGEVEAISCAVQFQSALLLMDERVGRNRARQEGVQVLGTLGILKLAKARGLLDEIRGSLDALVARGFRIAPPLHRSILVQVGETPEAEGA